MRSVDREVVLANGMFGFLSHDVRFSNEIRFSNFVSRKTVDAQMLFYLHWNWGQPVGRFGRVKSPANHMQ